MDKIIDYIVANWVWLSAIIWELVFRFWPTKWNLSILDNIKIIVDLLIKNKRVPDGNEVLSKTSGKNLIEVDINEHIVH